MTSQDQHPAPPTPRSLTHRSRLSAEFLVVVYIAVIAALAHFLSIPYLLFPELGALVYDVLIRPWGKWASQPIKLVVTPAITAFLGTVVTRHFSFNGLTVLLIVALSTLVIALVAFVHRSCYVRGSAASRARGQELALSFVHHSHLDCAQRDLSHLAEVSSPQHIAAGALARCRRYLGIPSSRPDVARRLPGVCRDRG